jgi:hypothetical protein
MTTAHFRPTHVVPQDGLAAWEAPDVSRPTEPLDPLLPVQLLDRRGDWGQILCANGWSAWVDGRLLVSVPQGPPVAGRPLARTADPRPLLARVEESLRQYRRAAGELADGQTNGETFRRRTQGLRAGMVVDGESVWLYDAEHELWVYCDGTRLSTYAASAGPDQGAGRAAGSGTAVQEPTRVVSPAAVGAREADRHPEGPEATQLVDPARPAGHAAHEPMWVVGPDPARRHDPVEPTEDEPARLVNPDPPQDGEPAPEPWAGPADHEPTRLMRPVEEAPAPHPPAGPGDP